jgi:hypothetical protein
VSKAAKSPVCKDCRSEASEAGGIIPKRGAPHPGPRCTTHHRAWKRAQKARTRDNRVCRVYGLAPGDYERLRASQGGICAVCGKWSGRNGRTKALAVDHDHESGEVRGLLCSTCNRTIGEYRDNPELFVRMANYLLRPPARDVLHRDRVG